MSKNPLGRGLSALLQEEIVPMEAIGASSEVDIDLIEVNKDQPRKHFDEAKIKELADSIASHGLIQPIVVNKMVDGKYQIVAGERRFRACRMSGLTRVPVIIKKLSDRDVLEIALIENIQRQELTAIEEAEGFQQLIEEYGYSHADLATAVGKSRSHVANLLRLNQLPDSIKLMVNNGQLSMGHARCLIGLDNVESLAAKIIANDLNVRQAEELAGGRRKKKTGLEGAPEKQEAPVDEDLIMLGQSLSEKFGVKVVVENSWNGGKITLHYSNLEELDSILTKFN